MYFCGFQYFKGLMYVKSENESISQTLNPFFWSLLEAKCD